MSVVLEAMGKAVAELGVPVMFGLPGSGNYEFVHAAREAGVSYVGSNHEAGAVGMADGWSRITGKPGLAMLSQGPGLTNGLTALTEAVKAGTSMVIAVVDAPRSSRHGNLNIDQVGVVSALGAGTEEVRSAATAVSDLGRALHRCEVEQRPVVLMIPLDLMHQEVPSEALVARALRQPSAPHPDPAAVEKAAAMIRQAERPVIVAGRGAIRSGAVHALRTLGEKIGAVLVASAPAKGAFAGDPFDLGISGSFSSPLARDLVAQSDLVLAFGASLNAWTTGSGTMIRPGVKVVQVDLDPRSPGQHHDVDLAVTADAAVVAESLSEVLGSWSQSGFRTDEVAKQIWSRDPASEFVAASGERLDPRVVTLELDRLLPAERTVTVDSGHFMGWPAKYLNVPDAAGFVYPQAFQCVGLGLGAAIGAAVAAPNRISVLAIGDGGSMLSPQELDTAVRHQLPLLVLIYNDSAYGAEVHRFDPIGLRVDLVQFPERNFAAMGEAVGAAGLTVEKLTDLSGLEGWLREPIGPMVVDLKINPTVVGNWVAQNSKAALA